LIVVACAWTALTLVGYPGAATAAPPRDDFETLVDVGGHRLYVHCMGRGGPTVILEAGAGDTTETWTLVQPSVARFTTVCSYDRAGLGRSEPGLVPRTSQTVVDELRALLTRAGIRGPYVLVGHSLGGFHLQLFARQDGGRRVTGVVLVDATPMGFPATLAQFGVPFPDPDEFPEGIDIRASVQQLEDAPEFPNIPLSVLVRSIYPPDVPAELVQAWEQQQAAQARFSCRGELVVAQGAGHYIQLDRPDVVIGAIERVVEAGHPNNARRLHPTSAQHVRAAPPVGQGARWSQCP
jgi:pimeloyl-ACP methyl ester carboxylesterase